MRPPPNPASQTLHLQLFQGDASAPSWTSGFAAGFAAPVGGNATSVATAVSIAGADLAQPLRFAIRVPDYSCAPLLALSVSVRKAVNFVPETAASRLEQLIYNDSPSESRRVELPDAGATFLCIFGDCKVGEKLTGSVMLGPMKSAVVLKVT